MEKHQLAQLRQQLPRLRFDLNADLRFQDHSLSQVYLDFYGINFVAQLPGVSHGFGKLPLNGYHIACHYWLPEATKGTLVIAHGYYDHLGIYGHLIRFGLLQGYAVLGFELPGHGLSSGSPAAIDSFDTYSDILQQVCTQAAACLPQPWHIVGQSTGGAVILNHLWRHGLAEFDKVMLLAPLVRCDGWHWVTWSHRLLKHLVSAIPRGVSASSHDQQFNHFIAHRDPLQPRIVSVDWVGAMRQWEREFPSVEPQEKPVLLIQGDADSTVDWRFNIPLIRAKLPRHQLHTIAGARHQLLNESEFYREQVFSHMLSYLHSD